jgi:hypothetical protein
MIATRLALCAGLSVVLCACGGESGLTPTSDTAASTHDAVSGGADGASEVAHGVDTGVVDDGALEPSSPVGDGGAPPLLITASYPIDGAVDVLRGVVVWADLTTPLPEELSMSVVDDTGALVPGEVHVFGGTRQAFAPSGRLAASRQYTVSLTTPAVERSWTFTTGSVASEPVGLKDRHAILELDLFNNDALNVVSPPGGDAFAKMLFPLQLMELTGAADGAVSLSLGIGDVDSGTGTQDLCQPTWSAEADASDNPWLVTSAQDLPHYSDLSMLPLGLGSVQMTLHDVQIWGALVAVPTGAWSEMADGVLRGWVDMRDMGIGSACNNMAGFVPGMHCEHCPNDPSVKECVVFWFTGLTGVLRPDISGVVSRTVEAIDADLECVDE